jgi:hypothetical protein
LEVVSGKVKVSVPLFFLERRMDGPNRWSGRFEEKSIFATRNDAHFLVVTALYHID